MTPPLFHVPPTMRAESHNTCAFAPLRSERFSFPLDPYAIERLSGDQKGSNAFSEPGKTFASGESRLRTWSIFLLSADVAVKAIFCPSGEITAASGSASLNASSGGGVKESRAARVFVSERLK